MPLFGKKKFKPEKVIPLSRFGTFDLIATGFVVPSAMSAAVAHFIKEGIHLVAIGFAATSIGAGVRFAKALDNYVVSKHTRDESWAIISNHWVLV